MITPRPERKCVIESIRQDSWKRKSACFRHGAETENQANMIWSANSCHVNEEIN